MRILEKEIHTNGTVYTLVKRTPWKAMYQAVDGQFEVFRVRVDPPTVIFGNEMPEREHYPSSEEFGKIAWCVMSRERAEEIYNELEEKKDEI